MGASKHFKMVLVLVIVFNVNYAKVSIRYLTNKLNLIDAINESYASFCIYSVIMIYRCNLIQRYISFKKNCKLKK